MRSRDPWRMPAWAILLGALVAWFGWDRHEELRPDQAEAPRVDERILGDAPQFSSHNEEVLIRAFFADRRRGFFLDVGCYKPIRASNTYYLERHLRWCGIAVDALAELGAAWAELRPRSRFFAFLVSDRSDSVDTFYRSDLVDVSSRSMERVARRKMNGQAVPFTQLEVPTITLTKLLDDNGVRVVDLVSLDIEGGEPAALDGFDIDRFRPALICLEVTWRTRERIHAYFERHDYARIERFYELDRHNEYYAPRHPVPVPAGGPRPHCAKVVSPDGPVFATTSGGTGCDRGPEETPVEGDGGA